MLSTFCVFLFLFLGCLPASQNTNENLSPTTVTRLVRELKNVESKPVEGIKVTFNESNVGDIQAEIAGPQGTPYEGGLFRLKLVVPSDFPSTPPKGTHDEEEKRRERVCAR